MRRTVAVSLVLQLRLERDHGFRDLRHWLVIRFAFLQTASADRPLVVLLDGLNQLSAEHRADRLNWLPGSAISLLLIITNSEYYYSSPGAILLQTGIRVSNKILIMMLFCFFIY